MKPTGCTMVPENIDEVLQAEDSAKWATLQAQNQFPTPDALAVEITQDFTDGCESVIDPQMFEGALLKPFGYRTRRYGVELDNRIKADYSTSLITGNCVKVFEIMDDLYPDLRFGCFNANPPFAKRFKVGDAVMDSTEWTWRTAIKRGCMGVFISNVNTIKKFNIDKHPFVYRFEERANVWANAKVVVGIVWWRNPEAEATRYYAIDNAWKVIENIVEEEKATKPPWNIWLHEDGKLRTYLSIRDQTRLDLLAAKK